SPPCPAPRLPPPAHGDHLPGLDLTDLGLDRSAGRLGLGAGVPGTYKWDRRSHHPHGADDTGRTSEEAAARLIDTVIAHESLQQAAKNLFWKGQMESHVN